MRIIQTFSILSFLIISGLFISQEAQASSACPDVPISGSYTVSVSCYFDGDVNGVESGDMTVNEGATLNVHSGKRVVWNPGSSIVINGSIAINKPGGEIRKAYLYYVDSEDRGYPDSLDQTYGLEAPAGGKRRSHTDFTAKWSLLDEVRTVGALSCQVRSSCEAGEVSMLRLSATANAHAELPAQANYGQYVCCAAGGTTLGTSCSGSYDDFLKLSGSSNAHVEKKTQANYANSACLSSSYGTPACDYSTDCATLGADYTCLASISGDTNAHIGNCTAYSTKICCTH